MKYFSFNTIIGLTIGLSLLTGCESHDGVDPTIAGIAVAEPSFQLLEDAAIRGGVAVILSNKNPNDPQGNYTVFAPNNDAFARLGLKQAADLDALQQLFLTNTLLYHVAGGTLAGSSLQAGGRSASAFPTGQTRRYILRGTDRYVNGSKILATDVKAANGTVHIIDKVLLATGGNIVESAVALQKAQVFAKPELTFLVAAVLRCNLQGTLSAPGPYTVFAPTDQAFKDAGIPDIATINTMDIPTLTSILANHVLINNTSTNSLLGDKFTSELPENTSVPAFGGRPLQLGRFDNGVLTVKGAGNTIPATMVIPDVQCTNGVVHVVDRVLLP
jgi:uncharacterized surface protein with fasciclin (FAS1) repeats